jgi:hypothetical protein
MWKSTTNRAYGCSTPSPMPTDRYHSPIPPQLWHTVRDDFGLPRWPRPRERLEAGYPDPEPVLR